MKLVKPIQTTELVVTDVICNKCGKSVVDDHKQDNTYAVGVKYDGGFESMSKLGIYDCVEYQFEICEACFAEFIKSFKIAPAKYSLPHANYENYANEVELEEE